MHTFRFLVRSNGNTFHVTVSSRSAESAKCKIWDSYNHAHIISYEIL